VSKHGRGVEALMPTMEKMLARESEPHPFLIQQLILERRDAVPFMQALQLQ